VILKPFPVRLLTIVGLEIQLLIFILIPALGGRGQADRNKLQAYLVPAHQIVKVWG
jgi:hypothetical protein